jgi:hypothetical protein
MKNKNYVIAGLFLVAGLVIGYLYNLPSQTPKQSELTNKSNCLSDGCLAVDGLNYPVDKLPESVEKALTLAIEDEYKAYTVYQKVIEKMGMVRPFSMIIRAEETHIASLKSLFDKYGLKVPENNWSKKINVATTISENCQIGVDAEIANAKLYREELLPAVSEYSDITNVFTNLMNASEQKHLTAFNKCN